MLKPFAEKCVDASTNRRSIVRWIFHLSRGDKQFFVRVEGYESKGGVETDNLVSSSKIEERISPRVVKSMNKFYVLEGQIDRQMAYILDYPNWLVETFENGFPEGWRKILLDYHTKAKKEGKFIKPLFEDLVSEVSTTLVSNVCSVQSVRKPNRPKPPPPLISEDTSSNFSSSLNANNENQPIEKTEKNKVAPVETNIIVPTEKNKAAPPIAETPKPFLDEIPSPRKFFATGLLNKLNNTTTSTPLSHRSSPKKLQLKKMRTQLANVKLPESPLAVAPSKIKKNPLRSEEMPKNEGTKKKTVSNPKMECHDIPKRTVNEKKTGRREKPKETSSKEETKKTSNKEKIVASPVKRAINVGTSEDCRGSRWTDEETNQLLTFVGIGNEKRVMKKGVWEACAQHMAHRSAGACRSRYAVVVQDRRPELFKSWGSNRIKTERTFENQKKIINKNVEEETAKVTGETQRYNMRKRKSPPLIQEVPKTKRSRNGSNTMKKPQNDDEKAVKKKQNNIEEVVGKKEKKNVEVENKKKKSVFEKDVKAKQRIVENGAKKHKEDVHGNLCKEIDKAVESEEVSANKTAKRKFPTKKMSLKEKKLRTEVLKATVAGSSADADFFLDGQVSYPVVKLIDLQPDNLSMSTTPQSVAGASRFLNERSELNTPAIEITTPDLFSSGQRTKTVQYVEQVKNSRPAKSILKMSKIPVAKKTTKTVLNKQLIGMLKKADEFDQVKKRKSFLYDDTEDDEDDDYYPPSS